MSCDMDSHDEEQQQKIANGEDVPKGHGGCGHDQPVLRREGEGGKEREVLWQSIAPCLMLD